MGPFCARKGMPRIQVRLTLCSSPTIAGVIVELSGVVVWIASTAVKAQHEGPQNSPGHQCGRKTETSGSKTLESSLQRVVHGREARAQKLNLPGVVLSTQPAPLGHIPWFVQKPPLPAHV